MPTNIGLGYSAKIVDGVLSIASSQGVWTTVSDSNLNKVGRAWGYLSNNNTIARITYISGPGGWSYPDSNIAHPQITKTVFSNQSWNPPSQGAGAPNALQSLSTYPEILKEAGTTPPTSGSPSASAIPIEGEIDMTGHKITKGAAGTAPDDFVILSQLTSAVSALIAGYEAGDQFNADSIAVLTQVVNNLPPGLTMQTVQNAINASVAEAVLNEVIDDAQKQALVDALIAQLSTVDTAILGRMTAAEGTIVDNQQRLTNLEAKDIAHDSTIGAIQFANGLQDQSIVNLTNAYTGLDQNVQSQGQRLNQVENRDQMTIEAITPVIVKVRNGALSEAIGVSMAGVTIDNSSDRYMVVTIELGSDNNGQNRVPTAYRVYASGSREKATCKTAQNFEAYSFVVLKAYANSVGCDFQLN